MLRGISNFKVPPNRNDSGYIQNVLSIWSIQICTQLLLVADRCSFLDSVPKLLHVHAANLVPFRSVGL